MRKYGIKIFCIVGIWLTCFYLGDQMFKLSSDTKIYLIVLDKSVSQLLIFSWMLIFIKYVKCSNSDKWFLRCAMLFHLLLSCDYIVQTQGLTYKLAIISIGNFLLLSLFLFCIVKRVE